MANITWKRGEHGSKVSKCGTFAICGGSTVGFALWVHGWYVAEFDLQGEAKSAAELMVAGGDVRANGRIWTRGMERIVRATDVTRNRWVTLADIAAL